LQAFFETTHPKAKFNLNTKISLNVQVPFQIFNFASDSVVDIGRFNKIILGFLVYEVFSDENHINTIVFERAPDAFLFNSRNVRLDFSSNSTRIKNRVRFYLKKEINSFNATIEMTPRRKGIFYVGLLEGLIEDAFCNAGISSSWRSFTSLDNVLNIEDFLQRKLPERLRNDWIRLDHQGYFIMVE
jgi:hypothetical protein